MTDTMIERLNGALEGRYRVERKLGEGGMATVFLADDLRHDRKVALKVLKPELAAVVGAERFLAEIKTTANLQHPHILALYDSGEADGFLYYVMPFIDGESLRDRLDREKQLPVDDAVAITRKVAAALGYAHEQGVVHRDIKPANILMSRGEPLVADFGIALALGSAGARLTETGLSIGTPYYMSPEQALGDQPVTEASDTYALACVLYELLVGSPPHTGPTAQAVLARIIAGDAPPVREQRPSAPPNVDAAVRCALERLPADRFASVEAFSAALVDPSFRYGGDEATPTRSGGRRRGLVAGAAGVALGLLVGYALWSGGNTPPNSAAMESRPLQLTFSGQAGQPAISPDGRSVAFVDYRCRQGSFGDCTSTLRVLEVGGTRSVPLVEAAEAIGPVRWSHDGGSVLFRAVLEDGRSDIFRVPRLGGAIQPVAPAGVFDTHPAADSLIVAEAEGDSTVLAVYDLGSGQRTDAVPAPDGILDVAWHPEGRLLAVRDGGTTHLIRRDGEQTDRWRGPGRSYVRWNASGSSILFFRVGTVREDDLVRLAARDGRFIGEPTVVRGAVPTIYRGELDIAREDGRLVIRTGDARGDTWWFRTDGSGDAERVTGGTTWYSAPVIAPDGSAAYYLRGDAVGDNLYRLDLATGEEKVLTAEPTPVGWQPTMSSDGTRLAYLRVTESADLLEGVHLPTGRYRSRSLENELWRQALPVDATAFVLIERTISMLDSLEAEPQPLFRVGPGDPLHAAVDRAGQWLAAVETDVASSMPMGVPSGADVAVYGMDGNERIDALRIPEGEMPPSVAWAADGTLLIGRWPVGDEEPSLWSWSFDDREGRRVAPIGAPCIPAYIRPDARGETGVCRVQEDRSDIWLYDGLGR